MDKRRTALVIEDDQDIALSSSLRLNAAGYETAIAGSAEEGLLPAVAWRPDVIVLDIRLPNMDGLAALRALAMQQSTRNIPLVALSACVGHKLAALEQGAGYFLRQPREARHLVATVHASFDPRFSRISHAN